MSPLNFDTEKFSQSGFKQSEFLFAEYSCTMYQNTDPNSEVFVCFAYVRRTSDQNLGRRPKNTLLMVKRRNSKDWIMSDFVLFSQLRDSKFCINQQKVEQAGPHLCCLLSAWSKLIEFVKQD